MRRAVVAAATLTLLAACGQPTTPVGAPGIGGHAAAVPPDATVRPSGAPSPRSTTALAQWSYAGSYGIASPPDAVPAPVATCSAGSGWLPRENRTPGTGRWRTIDWGLSPVVALYADHPSTSCGSSVTVHLGGRGASSVVVRALRMGWYAGSGARLVWSSRPVDVPPARSPAIRGRTVLSPAWRTTISVPVTASWPPGLYLLVADVHGRYSGAAPLVVRDDTARAASAVVYSSLTWAAYSKSGGASLYKGTDGATATRALGVSLQRPFEFLDGGSPVMAYDVPVAQMLDRAGVVADPLVDTDVDTWPSMLVHRTEVVLPGHSEYWTRRMYDALVSARNLGASIADLGANDVYWHARVTYGVDGLLASLFVARDARLDPRAAADPSSATVQWRHAPLLRNPSAVIGQSYTAVRARGGLLVQSVPPWLSGVPGLVRGRVLPHAAWHEVNGIRPSSYPVPDDVQVIAQGLLLRAGYPDQPASTTYYSTRAGGGVFDSGSTFWPCLIMRACHGIDIPVPERVTLWQTVRRVLVDFQTPQWGRLHPSLPTVLPSVRSLRTRLPAAAIGTYGLGD